MTRAELILRELSRSGSRVLFVPGNMDAPALAERQDTRDVVCLHGKAVVHGEACFIGLGGAIESRFGAPFEFSEQEAARTLSKTVEACSSRFLIVISHCPPRDTKLDLAGGRWHVGSVSVRRFIEEKRPALVICGHIHEAQGTDSIGDSLIVNVGAAAHDHYASIWLTTPLSIELRKF
jgi:Icc-related predicted phosphoesterase